MNTKWSLVLLVVITLIGFGASQSATADVVIPIVGDEIGGGGGGSVPIPGDWYMASGSSYGSAWGNIGGETMAVPDWVYSNFYWGYLNNGKGNSEEHDLFFAINFYTSGDVEEPNEAVNLGTGGQLNLYDVTIQDFDDNWYFKFNQAFSLNWNGGYSSYVDPDGYFTNGSFYGSASASPGVNLVASPQLSFNHWDGDDPRFGNMYEYQAGIQILGQIPHDLYTATAVPEPATIALLGAGAFSICWRRRRERNRIS